MPEEPASPEPTPANYQRTTGGHLRWQPPSPEHLQTLLPAYEILSIIGKGGMGAVYQGRQKSLDRLVAIKLLPPEAADNDMEFVARFKNEARTMAKMNHPAIVHVYDFGETTDGQLYIVMEYIDGTDVAKMIQSQGKLPPEHALAITAHVCDALQYAHTHGVVHRDIKPANILLNMEGQVKVADFGLAKTADTSQAGLTKTNMAMGTPDFVAPETLTPGMSIDGRADLYAVGVMLYNMLTGQVPRGAFRMPSVTCATDMRFDKIIGKAMEMDRELRYQTSLDLRRDLDVILTTPLAKPGVRTISVKARDLPQKPVGKSPSTPQQQRAPGSSGVPVRSQLAPTGGAPARPGANTAKTTPSTPPPAAPPEKSSAGIYYGIAAVAVIASIALLMFPPTGENTAPTPVAQTAQEKPKPAPQPPTTPLSGTFLLDVKDAKLSGGEADFKREAFEDHFLVKGWFPGSQAHKQSLISWEDVQVAAGDYDVTFTAGGLDSREFDLQLNVGKGRLSVNTFRPDTASMNATKDFPVGRIKLSSTASGVNLVCTKWSLSKPGMSKPMVLRRIRFSPAASPAPVASAPPASPDTALTFAGHRYQLMTDKLKWDAAKAKAESIGGHLATVTTKEEYDWLWGSILSKMKKTESDPNGERCFIGAIQRKAPDGPWEWITGEPFSLQPWMGKFPNDKSTGIEVATLVSKGWDDVGQNYPALSFLVEWDDAAPAKPAPLALTAPVNLLAFVDVKRDAVYGDWTLSPEGLRLKHASGTKLLGFHQDLPDEYDFEIEFTPDKGERDVIQILPVSGGTALHWRMGVYLDGAALFAFGPVLDGKAPEDPKRTEAVVKLPRLAANHRYRSTVEVRKGSLRALLDGKEVLKWSGDFKRFPVEQSSALKLRDPSQAGIGGHDSGILFHKAELRPPSAAPAVAEVVKPAEPAPKSPPMPVPAPVPAEPAPPADPRLAQLDAGYQTRYDSDAQKPFLAAVFALKQSYVANGLSRARAAAQSKGSLTEVTALDSEKTTIESGGDVPAEDAADTAESIKTLRSTYRTALARLAAERDARAAPLLQLYLGALDVYVADLTKADKIDEAKKVQALRDAKAKQATTPPTETAAASSQSISPGKEYTNSLGMKFVPVKGTDTMFCIHETRRQDYAAYAAENPAVDGSWKKANRNGIPIGGKDDHPVVAVNWDEAHQFCEWLSKKEGRTYRLPTDEEWSMAVGIGRQESRLKESTPESLRLGVKDEYPWGGDYPPKSKDKAGNYKDAAYAEAFKTKSLIEGYDDGFATTAPVMSFKPNKLGIYDLGGNADEWVEDWYNTSQKDRTTRGLSWYAGGNDTLSSHRGHAVPNDHNIIIGFRVVLEAPKSAASK
jgi:serine/threonine protein kinase